MVWLLRSKIAFYLTQKVTSSITFLQDLRSSRRAQPKQHFTGIPKSESLNGDVGNVLFLGPFLAFDIDSVHDSESDLNKIIINIQGLSRFRGFAAVMMTIQE